MKRFIYSAFAAVMALGICGSVFAMMCGSGGHGSHETEAVAAQANGKAVDVGNSACPVSGDNVDGKTTYEYRGKTYNFCCPMCIDEFKKDPAKYIKKIEAESAPAAPEHTGHKH